MEAPREVVDYVERLSRRTNSRQGVRRPLSIEFNNRWRYYAYDEEKQEMVGYFDPDARWYISQETRTLHDVPGLPISYTEKVKFPVLIVRRAALDRRWERALFDSRIKSYVEKMKRHHSEKNAALRKKYLDQAEDWAKDNYKGFLDWSDQFMLHQVRAKDPKTAIKRFADKYGRLPKRGLMR
jgi:hypothetical protein